jgi:uncharacterized protein YceK
MTVTGPAIGGILSVKPPAFGGAVMSRNLYLHLVALCVLLTGCGGVFVGFTSNPGFPTTVTGTVIRVEVGTAKDINGFSIAVTTVTLSTNVISSTFTFCGDQFSRFPINRQVRVVFVSGAACSTLNDVTLAWRLPRSKRADVSAPNKAIVARLDVLSAI